MTKQRPSVAGHGPELFGRGIDLLFGEADTTALALASNLDEKRAGVPQSQAVARPSPNKRVAPRPFPVRMACPIRRRQLKRYTGRSQLLRRSTE